MNRAPRARRPVGLVIAVLSLCGTVVSLMQTLVVPLLPDLPELLDTTADNASWLVTVTLLTGAVATPILSKVADMVGKRLVMVIALGVLVAGSVVCAVSTGLTWMLVGRALQGFAAALIPVGISIMRDEVPKERVGAAVALMSATLGIGAAAGLPLGGVIAEVLDWHSLFWVSAGMGALMLAAVLVVVPESTVRSPGRFDVVGAVLLSVSLSALLLAVSKGSTWGWTSRNTLLCAAVAAIGFAITTPWELRTGNPLVDLRTSARRPVLLTNVASLLAGFAMYANLLVGTQELQLPTSTGVGHGLTPTAAGLAMLPGGAVMVVLAPVSAALTRRFGARITLMVGSLVIAVGYAARALFTGGLWQLVTATTVISTGTAIAFAAMPILVMRFVPITETASANGLNTLVRQIGTSTSSAVVAAVLTAGTTTAAGVAAPDAGAFALTAWIAGAAAVLAAALALALPGRSVTTVNAPARDVAPGNDEVVVTGDVVTPDGQPVRLAVVTVLTLQGEHTDWSRADSAGSWSAALPGPGRYLVVCSADGWSSCSQVLDLGDRPQRIVLRERRELAGIVSDGGVAVADALVTLTGTAGGTAERTRTDDAGRYALPLPPLGGYVLTVLPPGGAAAHSADVVVTPQRRTVDLDLATGGPLVDERAARAVGITR
ncbi:MFS transporter [Saccharothrix longispora]|uniref:EmrB/QacA subfamily drug resistance transporter n=1 Tax=Saccharothrix longispora TaxID=33920 RepID=A0ABU1PRR2_9PSEU|nr:MFS transporter [Saccharothrix longispora]MDR6593340.1 EmrB/QacA subfamily drug resistance transporter [Saccharothrix longispora]